MSRPHVGVRYREDVGWEMRCGDCMKRSGSTHYWPLDDEFWDKRNLQRCRACHQHRRNQQDREKYWSDVAWREQRKASAKRTRDEDKSTVQVKRAARYAANIDEERARKRADYQAHRDARLAQSRERYWANRDAILARRRERAA